MISILITHIVKNYVIHLNLNTRKSLNEAIDGKQRVNEIYFRNIFCIFIVRDTGRARPRPLLALAGPHHHKREWVQWTQRWCRICYMYILFKYRDAAIVSPLPKNGIQELRNMRDGDDHLLMFAGCWAKWIYLSFESAVISTLWQLISVWPLGKLLHEVCIRGETNRLRVNTTKEVNYLIPVNH